MKKIYLFIGALMCVMGVNSVKAQATAEMSLGLSCADAQRVEGTSFVGALPPEASVLAFFGGDDHLSSTGMVWGISQTKGESETGWHTDFRYDEATATTAFTFKGRQGYDAESVSQMYALGRDVYSLDLSFTYTSAEGNRLSFSVWKVSSTSAEKLTSQESGWTSGDTYSVALGDAASTTPILSANERLVLIWNAASGGKDLTISEFSATASVNVIDLELSSADARNVNGTQFETGLPPEARVLALFGGDDYLSATGMIWGISQDKNPDSDFSYDEATATTAFTFKGRQGYSGESVSQMYALDCDVYSLDLSFTYTSDAGNSLSFSVWKVSSTSAEKLTSQESGWTSGEPYSVTLGDATSTTPILSANERLVLIWNASSGGNALTISGFGATASVGVIDYEAKLARWKAATLPYIGRVGGYSESLRQEIEGMTDYSQIADFESKYSKQEIVDGGYYYFKTTEGNYMLWEPKSYDANYTYAASKYGCFAKTVADPGINQIWQAVKDGESGYKFKACNIGQYLCLVNADGENDINRSGPSPMVGEGDASTFAVEVGENAVCTIKTATDGKYIRHEGDGPINYWNSEAKSWYIYHVEEIDITITDALYATTYLPFDIASLEDGLSAYAVTSATTGSAKMEKMASIPAMHGAILKAEEAKTYKLTLGEATPWGKSVLTGSMVDSLESADAYILAKPVGAEAPGLYLAEKNKDANGNTVTSGGTHFRNNANKAYLLASEVGTSGGDGIQSRFLVFDFGTETGICETEGAEGSVNGNAPIYDLSGRRVRNAQKGIYIVNGKKVVK